MKKIISMLLVLTIVVTTLVGVMVVDVNAGVTTEVDNGKTPRVWTLTYTSTEKDAKQIMATGKYILVPETVADGGKASYELGEITSETVFGMDSYHFNFKGFTFMNGTAAVSGFYTRLQSTFSDAVEGADTPSTTTRFGKERGSLTLNPKSSDFAGNVICGNGTEANGKVLRYTFYAYSTKNTSHTLAIQVACKTGGFTSLYLPGDDLYSPKGIPHKIDVYVWSDSIDNVVFGKKSDKNQTKENEFVYIAAIIDGNRTITSGNSANQYARVAEGGNGVNQADGILHPLAFYSLQQAANKTSFKVTATNSYIMHPYAEDGWKQLDRSKVSDDLFKNINLGASTTDYSATDKTGFITGFGKYNEKLEESLRTSTDNASIEIFESHYNNPASIYEDYNASNVKVISKTSSKVLSADELSNLTSMDNHYFIVNGVYVVPVAVADPVTYLEGEGVPFKVGSHNTVKTRIRHEDFFANVNTGDAFGGLQNGFYRFTNEPRSGIAFSQGASLYNSNGYFALTLYNGQDNSTKSTYLTEYIVEKNIVTAEFDAYFPEYPSGNFYLYISLCDDGAGKPQNKLIFNSSNKASPGNGNIVDVTGNSWNRIALAFDMTDTPTSGKIAIKAYVNGKLQKTFYSDNGDYTNEAKVQFAPLVYLRLYAPKYVSYGTLGSGKWYVGNYTPSDPAVSENKITPSNDVFVSESDLLIASNLSEDKLIELMKDYIPVYKITYNSTAITAINKKYDAVDGTVTELEEGSDLPTGAYRAFKGKVIKRWIEASPHFTVTDGVDGKKVYTLKDKQGERAHIILAVDNGKGEATIVFNGNKDDSFNDSVTYSGVCTGLPDIIAQTENAVEKKLVGFATVEAGKLPKVYTLTESGLNLRELTFNKDTNKAELSYRKFGNVANAVSFQLVVAAYDKDGKLLELKSGVSTTINNSIEDGEHTITFEPKFSAATLPKTHHYKVFMFDSLEKCIPLFKSAKINN